MTFEIGPISSSPRVDGASPARPAAGVPGFEAVLSAASADRAELSLPGSPPPAVLDDIGVAATRAEQLAAQHRELHFEHDEETGRVIIQVRDLASGAVIRTIPPSQALDLLTGGGR